MSTKYVMGRAVFPQHLLNYRQNTAGSLVEQLVIQVQRAGGIKRKQGNINLFSEWEV